MENSEFDEESLFAGKNTLKYNTQSSEETGTIKTICSQMKSEWIDKFEIRKGNIVINTKDKTEIKVAQSLGLQVNPCEVNESGELVASDSNLLLVDSNGTLTLPDNITSIGEGSFSNVKSDGITLKKVIIPYTVKEIKANAFNGNDSIEEIEIQTKSGKGLTTIGDYAFSNCSNLKSITMPDTITEIGADAFSSCKSLVNVKLSNKLTVISYEMFLNCRSLTQIDIPEGVTLLEQGAFSACINLEKLSLPASLETIQENVFTSCNTLNTIQLSSNSNFCFENGLLLNKDKTEIKFVTNDAKNVETFTVPNQVTSLASNLIGTSTTVKKVIIPASVSSISNDFFPPTIENIEIDTQNPNFIVSNGAIYNKEKNILYFYFSKNENVTIENTTTRISGKAFIYTNASTINLPSSVQQLDGYAIYNSNVKTVVIGEQINNIAQTAFISCNLDLEIDSKNNYYTADNGILYDKAKTKVICCYKDIEQANIPNGVTTINSSAFFDRWSLKVVSLPSTLKTIETNAFKNCTGLTELDIPSSVTSISNCFAGTSNLKKITIHKEKNSISGSPWGSPFGDRALVWKND